jgi:excisionase family DNA binding protein
MENVVEYTTKKEQGMAKRLLPSISRLEEHFANRKESILIEILDTKNVQLKIPPKAFNLLVDILGLMAEGKALSLIPVDSEIGTQQAADMLNVSRPHIIKLMESGEIPYHKVGSHRRIKLADFLSYKQKISKLREQSLQELADQAQELDLGY